MKPKVGDFVLISWVDIHAIGSVWHEEDKTLKPSPCETLGVVMEIEKEYIKTGATYSIDNGDNRFDEIAIPKGCIKEICLLKKSTKLTL